MTKEVHTLPDPRDYWKGAEVVVLSRVGGIIGRFILRVEPSGKRYWERL